MLLGCVTCLELERYVYFQFLSLFSVLVSHGCLIVFCFYSPDGIVSHHMKHIHMFMLLSE